MRQKTIIGVRYLFSAIFITTAVGKLLDNRGFAEVLVTYQLLPRSVLLPLALAISLGELYLGILLWQGRWVKRGAKAVVAINFGYLTLALVTLGRGISLTNCGCFGVFLPRPLTWFTVAEDAIIVSLSLIYLVLTQNQEGNI